MKTWTFKAVDARAARAADGSLLLSIVHKGTEAPMDVQIQFDGGKPGARAQVQTLAAKTPWAVNTLEAPEAIAPAVSTVELKDNKLSLQLPAYSCTLVRIPQ